MKLLKYKYKSDKKELLITSIPRLKVVELFAGVGGFKLGLESKTLDDHLYLLKTITLVI